MHTFPASRISSQIFMPFKTLIIIINYNIFNLQNYLNMSPDLLCTQNDMLSVLCSMQFWRCKFIGNFCQQNKNHKMMVLQTLSNLKLLNLDFFFFLFQNHMGRLYTSWMPFIKKLQNHICIPSFFHVIKILCLIKS